MVTSLAERVGCSTLCFRHLPLDGALERIAALGFRSVDIAIVRGLCEHADPSAPDDVRERWIDTVRTSGLDVVSLNVSPGTLDREEGIADRIAFIRGAFDLAQAVGAKIVTVPTGSHATPDAWLDTARRTARVVHDLVPAAEGYGIDLSVEAPHVDSLCGTIDHAIRFLELVADPRLTLTFDTSHVQAGGTPMRVAIGRAGPWIGHVHLRDYHLGDWTLPPGAGDVSFRDLFRGLSGRTYGGGTMIELIPDGNDTDAAEQAVVRARDYVHGILKG